MNARAFLKDLNENLDEMKAEVKRLAEENGHTIPRIRPFFSDNYTQEMATYGYFILKEIKDLIEDLTNEHDD